MRNWFSDRTVASQATGGSSILPCRTDERSEGVRNEQDAGRPAWRIEGRGATARGGVAQIPSTGLCVTESVIAVLPFRTTYLNHSLRRFGPDGSPRRYKNAIAAAGFVSLSMNSQTGSPMNGKTRIIAVHEVQRTAHKMITLIGLINRIKPTAISIMPITKGACVARAASQPVKSAIQVIQLAFS